MITAMVRTALLFTQMADGMMFHVHGTLDPFVKLVSMNLMTNFPNALDDVVSIKTYFKFEFIGRLAVVKYLHFSVANLYLLVIFLIANHSHWLENLGKNMSNFHSLGLKERLNVCFRSNQMLYRPRTCGLR